MVVLLHLSNILMSKDRDIDVFSNDASVLVNGDVVMVKLDVKFQITSIFSQLPVNYLKFLYEHINVVFICVFNGV